MPDSGKTHTENRGRAKTFQNAEIVADIAIDNKNLQRL
jgi:hypothetical protein